jgi:cytochrome c oxidase subunit I+III
MYNAWRSSREGEIAGDNPWGAGGLEWATSSPPQNYNFLHIPTVGGREPLWDNSPNQPIVTGLSSDSREVLVTKVLDADPEHVTEFPGPTIWPFLASLATTALFVGSIFTPWAVPIGSIPLAVTLIGWFWPAKDEVERHKRKERWEQK